MKSTIVKDTIIITVITLVAGFLLSLVQGITAEPIAVQEAMAKEEAYKAVFADAESFEQVSGEDAKLEAYLDEQGYPAQTVNEVMKAVDGSGQELGYAFTVTTSEGYGGDIVFAMGIKDDGTMNGISILTIGETAGLGMRADTDEFKNQFKDKKVEKFEYTKDGAAADNQIDAISGATITTNAMTNGVNAGLAAFAYEKGGN
ncbi:MAG: RnfABCDGE type electron transport complex subunit G [Blautia sp.]|jgi:electron transport complex protein RnfG